MRSWDYTLLVLGLSAMTALGMEVKLVSIVHEKGHEALLICFTGRERRA